MPMSVLLASNDAGFSQQVKQEFAQSYPAVSVFEPGDAGAENAELAACWCPDQNLLTDYPKLKLLHALSAGADHLGKPLLTSGLPVCRIVDPEQKHGMFEYILWGILNYQREFSQYRELQQEKHWHARPQRSAAQTKIGLLGLGEIGAYVAQKLAQVGYSVHGWSRSQKDLTNVHCYSGQVGLDEIVKQADVLVNLLPLNPSTHEILAQPLFDLLPKGAYLINCGRGSHLVPDDLINAVNNGQLKGALLDVFDQEPLPSEHPLWSSEDILITPHIASSSSIAAIVGQVMANMARFEAEQPLNNQLAPSA